MEKAYLLGIDAGTTVVKSVVFDLDGNEISRAGNGIRMLHPHPGWAEHDMNEVWQATVSSIRGAIRKAGVRSDEIKGLSVSAQGAGSWFIDKEGKPTCNAVSWADGRAASIIDDWRPSGNLMEVFLASGFMYYSGSGPGIIVRWFAEHDPTVLEKSKYVMWCCDWVRFCLTGVVCTDEPDASIAMCDPRSRRYSKKVFRLTGIEEYAHLFPPVMASQEVAGKVTKKAAEETGLAEGTPVAVGAWDCSSTALGMGCTQSNEAASIVGTAGIHLCVSDKPLIDEAFSMACHAVPDRWLINSMAMTAANNLDWFEREFCLAERLEAEKRKTSKYDVINEEVDKTPLGSNGVMFLPFLQGERAPFVEPRARGEFVGLGDWSSRRDCMRAVYEGVALATRHNYEAMEKGLSFSEVRLGGGGAQSRVWAQIIADCTGKTMKVTAGSEFGARGAAINAAVALGIYGDHREAASRMVSVVRVQEPRQSNTEKYSEIFKIYVRLIESRVRIWVDMYNLLEGILRKA